MNDIRQSSVLGKCGRRILTCCSGLLTIESAVDLNLAMMVSVMLLVAVVWKIAASDSQLCILNRR